MHLRKLEVENFRLFKSLVIELDEKLPNTLLVAPNGHGKTAVLEAMASALGLIAIELGIPDYGAVPLQHSDAHHALSLPTAESSAFPRGEPTYPVRVEATLSIGSEEFKLIRELRKPDSEHNAKAEGRREAKRLLEKFPLRARPIVAYYDTSRFGRRAGMPSMSGVPAVESPLPTAGPDPELLRHAATLPTQMLSDAYHNAFGQKDWRECRIWISELIVRHQVEGRLPPQLAAVTSALKDALSLKGAPTWVRDWSDLGFVLRGADCIIPYSRLSDGYRVVAGVVVDIIRRISIACPDLTEETLKNGQGIVLIDELDQHLHPEWQRRILRDLKRVFPGIQFIATTHAPEVLIGAANLAMVLGIERSEDGKSPLSRPIEMEPGAGADRVLSGDAFELTSTIDPESSRLLRDIAIAYTRAHLDEASRQTYERLREEARALNLPSRFSAEERLVLDIIDHIQQAHPGKFEFEKMSWNQLQELRKKAIETLSLAQKGST